MSTIQTSRISKSKGVVLRTNEEQNNVLFKAAGNYLAAVKSRVRSSENSQTNSAMFLSDDLRESSEGELSAVATPNLSAFKAADAAGADLQVYASPLQIWEGTVLHVNEEERSMEVSLSAQMTPLPEHTAEIDLEWVSPQDLDLVKPGAVFYLTLFKRTKRGSIENSQELRFRRVPNWTRRQLQEVRSEVETLRTKFKVGRVAE